MANNPSIDLDKRLAGALGVAIETTLRDTFNVQTSIESWSVAKGPLGLSPYVTSAIDMKQGDDKAEPSGRFIVAFSREVIEKILKTYGIEDVNDQKVVNDAVEEVTNMMFGMVKTMMNKVGYHFVMEIPYAFNEAGSSIAKLEDAEKLIVPFLAEGHRCRIVIAPETKSENKSNMDAPI